MDIPEKTLRKLLRRMMKIRHFETRVKELFAAGEMPGFVHLYLGEEAIAAGACAPLNEDDYITSTHRGHGHIIAKGGDMARMMAELYGKATGYNKGKGGSLHIAAPKLGILGANGIVGAGIPIATGAGLSAKLQDTDQVTVCFFGDGATNQGTFHEAINIGAAFSLPVIYVCENNLYGVGTRQCDVRGCEDIADRAKAYGIPGVIVDGNDVIDVYEAVSEAIERARAGSGPTLIEAQTYRWRTHFEGEPDTYRPPEEVERWKERDPLTRYREWLIEEGVMSEEEIAEIEDEILAELDDAVEFARQSPLPEPETALKELWA